MFLSSLKLRPIPIIMQLIIWALRWVRDNFRDHFPAFTFAAVGIYALGLLDLNNLFGSFSLWALSILSFILLRPLYGRITQHSEGKFGAYFLWVIFMTSANALENICTYKVIEFQKEAMATHTLQHPYLLLGIVLILIPVNILQTLLFLTLPQTIRGSHAPYQTAWKLLKGRIILLSSLFFVAQLLEKLPNLILNILNALQASASGMIYVASSEPLFIVFSWYFIFVLAHVSYEFVGKGSIAHSFLAKDV